MVNFLSRYDLLQESEVIDPITKEKYPDPLSINYDDGELTKVPFAHQMSDADLDKWWLFFFNEYSKQNYPTTSYDDLLLNINGVPYLGTLQPGSVIYIPDYNDLQGWVDIAVAKSENG
jgi:hypothetical protein